jgi:hypothetical protein
MHVVSNGLIVESITCKGMRWVDASHFKHKPTSYKHVSLPTTTGIFFKSPTQPSGQGTNCEYDFIGIVKLINTKKENIIKLLKE